MKATLLLISALACVGHAYAASKPCDELKGEIATKMDAKGVKHYVLDVVAADKVADQKVVGSCEGGTKKIVYSKK